MENKIKWVIQELKNINIPIAYNVFKSKQKPPFMVYVGNGQTTFMADNGVYTKEDDYIFELYFLNKNSKLEDKIENIFIKNKIIYEKSEDIYIDTEDMYFIRYYI